MRTRGITIPELVVVLAVLTILGAYVFATLPRLQGSTERSNKTECLRHQKNIGLAVALYSSDGIHGVMPPGGIAGLNTLYGGGNGIMADITWFTCPNAAPQPKGLTGITDDSHTNFCLDAHLSRKDDPSKIICSDEPLRHADGTLGSTIFANHIGGANCLYMDGHVKWYATDNPDDDTDSTSIYEGTSSTTNTYID